MLKRSAHRLGWWLLMLALLLALLFTLVRLLLPAVSGQREQIAAYLSEQLGVQLSIDNLQASWPGYLPQLSIRGLEISAVGESGPDLQLSIDHIEIEPDPWRSLLQWQPVFHRLQLTGSRGLWRQRDSGWWQPAAADTAETERAEDSETDIGLGQQGWSKILGLILSQPQVGIGQAELTLVPRQGAARTLLAPQLLLENAAAQHQLSGELRLVGLDEDSRLTVVVQAFNTPADPLQGDYAFYLKLDSLGPELFELFDVQQRPQRLRAGTELWGRWSASRLQSLQGRLAVGELQWGEAQAGFELNNAHVDYALIPRPQGYQLQFNDLYLSGPQSELRLPKLAFDAQWQQGRVLPQRLQVPVLELNTLQRWLQQQALLPVPVREALAALHPRGELRNLRMDWLSPGDWKDFSLQADAERLEVEAYYGAPSVSGVSGLIEANLDGGQLHLKSDDFSLHFPREFDQSWSFVQADGVIRWALRPDGVLIDSGLLHLSEDGVSASGRFSIDLPYAHEEQTELTLLIGMTDSDGRRPERYVPRKEVGDGLYHWLGSAITGARLKQAGLLLHGGTRHLEPHQPLTVQLFFDIGDAQLQYDPAWPPLRDAELFLMIRDGDLRVDLQRGKFLDTDILGGYAYKALHNDSLQVAVMLQGPGSDVDKVLRSAPLQEVIGDGLDDWALAGKVSGQLRLVVPVAGEARAAPEVQADVSLSEGQFSSERLNLRLTEVKGPLRFSTAKGLSSTGLSGRLFDQPVSAKIVTQEALTRVSLQGRTGVPALQEWTGVSALQLLQGTLAWSGQLELCSDRRTCRSRFALQSALQGVSVDLPGVYGLKRDESGTLALEVSLATPPILNFSYGDLLRARFDLGAATTRGALHLGTGAAELPSGSGLYVDGRIAQLDVAGLRALIARLSALSGAANAAPGGTAAGSERSPLRQIDVTVDRFELGSFLLQALHTQVQPQAGGWSVQLDGPQLSGHLLLPAGSEPIRAELAQLSLTLAEPEREVLAESTETTLESTGTDEAVQIDPADVPAVDFRVDALHYKGLALGRWQGQLRTQGNSLRLQSVRAAMSQLQLQGEAYWQPQGQGHTGITLQLDGKDIGRQLELWGMEPVIESETLKSSVQLQWPGAPWQLAAAQLDGAMRFETSNGRLIESGSSANLLRVFGILNFNTLGRRLRLDFSDLFKKGVAFDRLSGSYQIDQGIASTDKPLTMKGPSADLKATGQLDLVRETVDKEIEVVLPVTGNVPFAAVLLGAPQVAGAVFLIDKLIGDKLERVTTLRYRLSGDWGDPQAELLTQAKANDKEAR